MISIPAPCQVRVQVARVEEDRVAGLQDHPVHEQRGEDAGVAGVGIRQQADGVGQLPQLAVRGVVVEGLGLLGHLLDVQLGVVEPQIVVNTCSIRTSFLRDVSPSGASSLRTC